VSTRDPYEVLGVSRAATTREIRAAYVARARHAHPDIVGQRGTDVMRALNDAWEVLKDPSRRSALDADASAQGGEPRGAAARGAASARRQANEPFWTGAAGPPPGRPQGPVLDFGIFAGWSLGEIARRDRGYLVWLRDRPEAKPYRTDIARLIDPTTDAEPARRTRRRR
jgi:curved DNA-binding protein CbpA